MTIASIYFRVNILLSVPLISSRIYKRQCIKHKLKRISTCYRKSNVTHVRRSDTPIFLTDVRDFFQRVIPIGLRSTRKKSMNVSLHLSRGKIPYNALQIYLIFYALLFLSVAASRMVDGISRIIDSIWLASIFRFIARRGVARHRHGTSGEGTRRCEFNYFRSETSLPLLLYGNLTYRKPQGAYEKRETRNYICVSMHSTLSTRRDELSPSRSEIR